MFLGIAINIPAWLRRGSFPSGGAGDQLLMENGTDSLLLENGSDIVLLETN